MGCKCFGGSFFLLIFLFLSFSASALVRQPVSVYPHTDPEMQKKLEWLSLHGSKVRRGEKGQRYTTYACYKDGYYLIRRDWGLEKEQLVVKVVDCPDFF